MRPAVYYWLLLRPGGYYPGWRVYYLARPAYTLLGEMLLPCPMVGGLRQSDYALSVPAVLNPLGATARDSGMDMWDWKAGNWQGITDSEERAREHAESHLERGMTARVVKVSSRHGHTLGSGWTGTRTEQGEVDWQFSPGMWTKECSQLARVPCGGVAGWLFWAAGFVKDFVVRKDFAHHGVQNPSQLQKFTVNRVAVAVGGAGGGWCCGRGIEREVAVAVVAVGGVGSGWRCGWCAGRDLVAAVEVAAAGGAGREVGWGWG